MKSKNEYMVKNNAHYYPLGILGGSGPEATNLLFKKIIRSTMASNDFDHVPLLIFNETRIHHAHTDYINEMQINPKDELAALIDFIESTRTINIVIACNSLHYYEEIFNNRKFNFINMITETINYLRKMNFKDSIYILGSSVTTNLNLYSKKIQPHDSLIVRNPSIEIQSLIDNLIDELKSTRTRDLKKSYSKMKEILSKIGKKSLFVIACTELSLLSGYLKKDDYNVLDALDVLAVKSIIITGYDINKHYIDSELTCQLIYL